MVEDYELKYTSYIKKLFKHWFKKDKFNFVFGDKFNGNDWRSYQLFDDVSHLTGCKVKIVYYFENQYYLALNHWMGIMRMTLPDGQWYQYFISTAAGKDDCVLRLEESMVHSLHRNGFNFDKNKVIVDKLNLKERLEYEFERY